MESASGKSALIHRLIDLSNLQIYLRRQNIAKHFLLFAREEIRIYVVLAAPILIVWFSNLEIFIDFKLILHLFLRGGEYYV